MTALMRFSRNKVHPHAPLDSPPAAEVPGSHALCAVLTTTNIVVMGRPRRFRPSRRMAISSRHEIHIRA